MRTRGADEDALSAGAGPTLAGAEETKDRTRLDNPVMEEG